MKKEAANHTKMKRLCRYLDVPRCMAAGIMELLWHLTSVEAPAGDIGKLSNEDIALGIDYKGDEDALIAALHKAGWIDEHPDHRFVIHDWWDHCEDSVHMKLARLKRFFADGKAPKLGRLPRPERAVAEKHYGVTAAAESESEDDGVRTDSESVRTTSAQREPDVDTPDCLPSHTIPSHTIPNQNQTNDNRTEAQGLNSTRSVDDVRPSVKPLPMKKQPIEIPAAKPIVRESTKKPGEDKDRIVKMTQMLHDYLSMNGTDFHRKHVGPPDDTIVLQSLAAVGEASIERVGQVLRDLSREQSPRHPNGPKGYAWFPRVLAEQFRSAAA